jgi:hypothetical protein
MARNADDTTRQSPTPSTGGEGSDLRSVAGQIEGLLDDDGHFNPGNEPSRGHPDYDESESRSRQHRDSRGRFQKTADDSDDAENEDTSDEEIEAAADDVPDEDTEQTDDGDTNEEIVASADDEAQPDDQETTIETLAQFAEALEVPLDDLKAQLQHTFNAAGEEVTVTLAELEKGYQKDADYRRSTAKLAEERKATEQQFQQRLQDYEQQNTLLAQQMHVAEQLVAAELEDPRLMELRQRDPAEWTARREEIGQRLGALRNARQQAAQNYQNFVAQNMKETRERELTALQSAVPEFGDAQRTTAKDTLASLGLTAEEVGNLMDHRLIVGALELAQLRKENAELKQLKESAQNTVKRVKKEVPKLQKPGKSRTAKPVRKDNVAKLRERARKTGRVEDAAKVIEQFL